MKTQIITSNLAKAIMALFVIIAHCEMLASELTITQSGSQVILSWPQTGTNDFYLQSATSLSTPVAWTNAADPARSEDSFVITNQAPNTTEFYRLQAWDVLFDGTNTAAFGSVVSGTFPSNSWFVTNGTLGSKVVANAANLMIKGTYTNFELRFSWKTETNGNSGIFYRGGTFPEYQLFDDANVTNSNYSNPSQYMNPVNQMGAVYGHIAPTNQVIVPTGEWNECRVSVQGYNAKHWLNGNVIVDYQINDPAYANVFVQATNTFILFQNKGNSDNGVVPGVVYFRDIKIRRLP